MSLLLCLIERRLPNHLSLDIKKHVTSYFIISSFLLVIFSFFFFFFFFPLHKMATKSAYKRLTKEYLAIQKKYKKI